MNNLSLKVLSSESILDNFPIGISEYLNKYFWGSFISDIKKEKDNKDQLFFKILVSDGDHLYHLKFNLDGIIEQKETEQIWELCEYVPID
jgi:hypothetical protein